MELVAVKPPAELVHTNDSNILEAIRRNAVISVVNHFRNLKEIWRRDLQCLAGLTNHVQDLPYPTIKKALQCLYRPEDADIGFVDSDEWYIHGGAQWLVHEWVSVLNDLLLRILFCRISIESHGMQQRSGKRLQMHETGFEKLESFCLGLRDLLLCIMSPNAEMRIAEDAQVCTADFWLRHKQVCKDNSESFWKLWWAIAVKQMALIYSYKITVTAADAKRALELLQEAALHLYRVKPGPCLDELDKRLLYDIKGDKASCPVFTQAVDVLGLRPYCRSLGTPAASKW